MCGFAALYPYSFADRNCCAACFDAGFCFSVNPLFRYNGFGFYQICGKVFYAYTTEIHLERGKKINDKRGKEEFEGAAPKAEEPQQKEEKGTVRAGLLGIKTFTKHGLKVGRDTFVLFSVVPTNISVLSYENIEIKINHLMMVLSAVPDIEVNCTDAAECFDTNKSYLLKRIENEPFQGVRELLKKDFEFLDNLNVEGSTARQFLFIVRCKNASDDQVLTIANRVEKIISEQNFDIKRLKKDDIKRFLAIYYDASLNGESIPDYDGIQYLKDGKDD